MPQINHKYIVSIFDMNINLLNEKNDINRWILSHNYFAAFRGMEQLVAKTDNDALKREFSSLFDSYKYMLDYMVKGYDDPERDNMLNRIAKDMFFLTDRLVAEINSAQSTELFYIRRSSRIADAMSLLGDYEKCNASIADSLLVDKNAMYEYREKLESDLFSYIWTSFPASAADMDVMKACVDVNAHYPTHFKQLMLGAIFLSLLQFFDEQKLLILLNTYGQYVRPGEREDSAIAMRALVYAVIAMYRHSRRTTIYDDIDKQLAMFGEIESFSEDLQGIFINLVKAKYTDDITRQLEKDIMPGLMNLAPDIIEEAKKGNGVLDLSNLEENPEWKDKLDKSGITKKIREFSELQSKGNDVFMNTFVRLKNFPFFKQLYNWFRPFHYDNSHVAKALAGTTDSIKTIIDKSSYLCDSDKFSFALSMGQLAGAQRDMLLQQFDLPDQELGELSDIPNPQEERLLVVNSVIKDMYRFFKLFSRRAEFADIFKSNMNLMAIEALQPYFKNEVIISSVADTYFESKQYKEAASYYEMLLAECKNVNTIYLQKLAFAYQNIKEHRKALKYYLKYSLAKENDVWNIKRIAQCYRTLGQTDEASKYMNKALELNPDSVSLNLQAGHYLLEDGKIDEAITLYYKVDYIDNKDNSAWRPLAWCLFLKKDFEQSRKYYNKIIDNLKIELADYMNFGHLCLAENHFEEAMAYYYNAYTLCESNIETFRNKWDKDVKWLVQAGVNECSIPLIADAIALRLTGKL